MNEFDYFFSFLHRLFASVWHKLDFLINFFATRQGLSMWIWECKDSLLFSRKYGKSSRVLGWDEIETFEFSPGLLKTLPNRLQEIQGKRIVM